MAQMITSAEEGQKFTALFVNGDSEKFTVKPSCGTNNGRWYCIPCDKVFTNNFHKDTHLSKIGNHQLAWICIEHGAEVP